MGALDLQFPYGAVYFRKSNPPEADWARNYAQAAADGMNIFRHWFLWSAIEPEPGRYEWSAYDRHLELAAEHGIRTIIAEKSDFAPEWAYRELAGCELQTVDGHMAASAFNGSSGTGGTPGMCLDHDRYRATVESFLRALFERYRGHPGLGGYDLWNECNVPEQYCYCPATAEQFRRWLRQRYGSLEEVGEAWQRHGLVDWADVRLPVGRSGHAQALDWMQFRIDRAHELLRWRVDLLRSIDQQCLVSAHGIAASLTQMTGNAVDDWRAAAEVESYGMTWVVARRGSEPWRQWSTVDLVRSASREKPFWHAEMQGGPLWLQPQVIGRERDDGRVAAPEDIRLWNLVSFAGGARGLLYLRWRPLLNGPLFGAFGPYGLDGRPTDRSRMASSIARWANEPRQARLWAAAPVRGEVGMLVVPESQMMSELLHGETTRYSHDVWGAYRGFFDLNVQVDYVRLEDIDRYDLLYLPAPFMLTEATCQALAGWVERGGRLVSEGCPGYFGDRGWVRTEQPGGGLGSLFGARERFAEFMPDLFDRGADRLALGGRPLACGLVRQGYELDGGREVGVYDSGEVAAVEHRHGAGRTLLVGTCPGTTYSRTEGSEGSQWFRTVLSWAEVEPNVRLSAEGGVTARLHRSESDLFLWVTNPSPLRRQVRARLSKAWGAPSSAEVLWGSAAAAVEGEELVLEVEGRDATVLRVGA